MADRVLRFSGLDFDLGLGRLQGPDGEIALSRMSRRLLCYLVANRSRLVPLSEIRDEVWAGVHVSEAAVHQAVRQLRKQLGDDGRRQQAIQTTRGAGYRFVAPVEPTPVEPISANDARRYVGRDLLLDDLKLRLAAALDGDGGVILLTGEPGVGKSRTAEELIQVALDRETLVLSGSPGAHSGAPPYWPWPALFSALSLQRPVAQLRREVEDLAPQFLRPDHPQPEMPKSSDPENRFRLFDAATRCLVAAGRLGPLLLWLDDLHEVGGATLELLDHIAAEISDGPILILCGYRENEASQRPEMASCLARMAQRPNVFSCEVRPLDSAESARLIQNLDPPVRTPDFIDLLSQAVEGNPFYAIELTRYLRSSVGTSDPTSVDWQERIPEGMEHVLSARLAALSDDAHRVLTRAAFLGTQFDPELLREIQPPIDVTVALNEARALGLTHSDRDLERFSHPLIRDAIVSHQRRDPERAQRLHLRIGDALVQHAPRRIGEAAFHFAAAMPLGGLDRTVEYLIRAAESTVKVFDDEQASLLYERAIALLDDSNAANEAQRCAVLVAAGEVAVRGARPDAARGMLREAASLARDRGLEEFFCRAVLGLAYRDEILGIAEAEVATLLEEALDDCQEVGPELRVRLLSALAVKLRYEPGAFARAQSLIDESIGLAKASQDPGALARALEDASFIRWSVEDPEGWIELNRQIVEAASEARDPALLFRGAKGLGTGFMEIGDRDATEREFARCDALAKQGPAPYLRAIRSLQLGALAMLDGRFGEGERHASVAAQSGLPAVTPLAAVQIFYHRLETGRLEDLEAPIRSLVESSPGIGAWRCALARLLVESERLEEAEAQLELAGPLAEQPRDRNWLAAGALATQVCVQLGKPSRCEALLEALEPHARVNVVLGHGALFFGNTAHFSGLLASALGRRDDAERWLRSALAMHQRMRSRPWVLRSQVALALNAAPDTPAQELAVLTRRLRDEAQTLGMSPLLAREIAMLETRHRAS